MIKTHLNCYITQENVLTLDITHQVNNLYVNLYVLIITPLIELAIEKNTDIMNF